MTANTTPKKYDLILTDNAWAYDNKQQNDPARGGLPYADMSMKDLYELPIWKAAKDDAILISWCTFPKLVDQYYEKYDPLSIIRAWGFRPVTAAFVWVKTNKKLVLPDWEENPTILENMSGIYSGLGRYTNSNVEFAFVARRGKGLKRQAKNVKQVILAPIGKHSAKPQVVYDSIDRLYGINIDRVELFARKENPPPINAGWDTIGLENEPSIDIREWIKQYD